MNSPIRLAALIFTGFAGMVLSPAGFCAQPAPAPASQPSADRVLARPLTLPGGMVLVDKLEKPAAARQYEEKDFGGYLLVYFKDQTHGAYFAVSQDGFTFTDINDGKPVFDGAYLAEQKGVRDPSIARGPDGAFYLAMTDLHVNGQRAGVRTTQWERPEAQYGWGNNRSLVMMKSYDMQNWSAVSFRIDKAFSEFAEVGCCWAPAMIYDREKGKMMISFTLKIGRGIDHIYYSYTNDEFTKMETTPKILFRFPAPEAPESSLTDDQRNRLHVIDSDITYANGKYHLFYSSKESGTPGIEHSVSDRIDGVYPVNQKRIDGETISCEAPNMFKRLGTNVYVLMFDAYGAGNMGFCETTDFETFKNIGRFNQGVMKTTNFTAPKHGAVTYLTADELKAIARQWKLDMKVE